MQPYVYQCGEREIHGHLSCIIQKRHHQFWLALKLGCRCTPFFVFRIFRLFVFSHSVVSDSCDPMDCSLPGYSVHEILQARILEWIVTSYSRGSSPPRDGTYVSCIGRRILDHLATDPHW